MTDLVDTPPAQTGRRADGPLFLPVLVGLLYLLAALGAQRERGAQAVASPSAEPAARAGGQEALEDGGARLAIAAAPFVRAWRVADMKDDPNVVVVEGAFGRRSLVNALAHAHVTRAEALRVAKAFDGIVRFEHPAHATFALAKEKAGGRVVAFEHIVSPDEIFQARTEEGRLVGKKLELHIERRTVEVGLAVKEDLAGAVEDARLAPDLLRALDEALDGHVDLGSVRRGARLRVLADEERIEADTVYFPRISALEYTPPRGSSLRVYHHERAHGPRKEGHRDRHAGHYDARGQRPYRGQWRSPVPSARVTSRFNPQRLHPVLHVVMPHNGVDFGAASGTPVYATAPGVVKSVGDGGPCGNMVQIDHDKGLTTAYCHLSRFAPGLHAGQHVEAKQLVGYVGQTGRVTGPHLHFAVKRGEAFIDPLAMKLDGVVSLPARERAAFDGAREGLDRRLDAILLPGAVEPDGAVPAEDDELIADAPDLDGGAAHP